MTQTSSPARQIEARGEGKSALLIHVHPFPLSVASLCDIADRLVDRGYRVDAVDAFHSVTRFCPEVKAIDVVSERIWSKYRRFILPRINGRDLTPQIDLSHVKIPDIPGEVDTLRAATKHGARIGLAALSTAASYTGIAERYRSADYGEPLKKAWKSAVLAAAAAEQLRHGYDEIYIYNGRSAETRPFCDVLEKEATVFRHDAGTVENSYFVFPGAIHDSENMARLLTDHPIDNFAGEQFFERQRKRKPGTPSHLFTLGQARGMLPEGLYDTPFVAMFTSSEDEFFAINDTAKFGAFETQFEAALAVAAICQNDGKALALRMHPHLAEKNQHWRKSWDFEQLQRLGAHVILPNEPIDSYALMDMAELVVTCGSTVGIEAAFHGKPSLVIGDSYACALGICVSADTSEEIAEFVRSPRIASDAKNQAIVVGSAKSRFGEAIPRLFSGMNPEHARLDGRIMDPTRFMVRKFLRFYR